ncbi:MAG: XRE family transcriptional regulator [Pseudomonadota bacterium]
MKKIDTLKDDNRITESSGNVFLDLGFPPEEAALLAMRADLMAKLRLTIDEKKWTQAEAAKVLGIAQSRVSDLVRGKWEKFSLDMLITLASRAGLQPRLELAA